jgi:predicted Zn-dependent protease
MYFDRGVRLLQARAWTGARDAFREAAEVPSFRDAAALNEAVACLWLGNAGHQEALARLRELRQRDPRSAAVHFNLGVAFLSGERNPSEAMRSLRSAVDAAPDMADAWWALGLAAAMRSDAAAAASAFARAADGGCVLPAPGSLHGVIPAREMAPALEALRGLARFCPTADGPPVSLAD